MYLYFLIILVLCWSIGKPRCLLTAFLFWKLVLITSYFQQHCCWLLSIFYVHKKCYLKTKCYLNTKMIVFPPPLPVCLLFLFLSYCANRDSWADSVKLKRNNLHGYWSHHKKIYSPSFNFVLMIINWVYDLWICFIKLKRCLFCF